MPLNPNIALIPSQGVQAQGSAIDNMFNTYYKSAGNARQNALLDLQTQGQAFSQDIQADANSRTNEAHSLNQEAGQFKLDQAQGHQVYRALKSLEGLDPQSRAQQIDILMPGLAQFGFDADDREMLSTEEGYQQAMQIAERFNPVSANKGSFGRLTEGLVDGKRVYFQTDSDGNEKIVDGITPPKSPSELALEAKLKDAEDAKNQDADVATFDISNTANKFVQTLQDPEAESATGLTGMIEGGVGRMTGSKAGVLKARLSRYSTAIVLQAAEALSGAMSDGDIALLKSTMPKDSDDVAIWQDWYESDLVPTLKTNAKKKGVEFSTLGVPETIQMQTEQPAPPSTDSGAVIKWSDL